MNTTTIQSLNVGTAQELPVGDEMTRTGIVKVPHAGAQRITANGIDGDYIANLRVHGGVDQALYLYSAEDAAYWSDALGQECPPGFFGENLTIDRWWPEVRVGDRLSSGDVTLELSFPRVPCATLAARVGDPRFVKRFAAANRPGMYARVLTPGALTAGDTFTVQPAPNDYPLGTALFAAWHRNPRDHQVFRAALHAPLPARWRAAFEYVLAGGAG